jgi:hypothetical protein
MTVQMLINELNKIEDKNRKVVLSNILHSDHALANISHIEGSSFGKVVYLVADR